LIAIANGIGVHYEGPSATTPQPETKVTHKRIFNHEERSGVANKRQKPSSRKDAEKSNKRFSTTKSCTKKQENELFVSFVVTI